MRIVVRGFDVPLQNVPRSRHLFVSRQSSSGVSDYAWLSVPYDMTAVETVLPGVFSSDTIRAYETRIAWHSSWSNSTYMSACPQHGYRGKNNIYRTARNTAISLAHAHFYRQFRWFRSWRRAHSHGWSRISTLPGPFSSRRKVRIVRRRA